MAAGIAVYESPQFRRWVQQSRRKIAVALYNLGDEIHPRTAAFEDISMTEETGEAAEERRRRAREEIEQRRQFNQSRRRRSTPSTSAAVSFDTLVNQDGTLRTEPPHEDKYEFSGDDDFTTARSTALDTSNMTSLQRRRGSIEQEALTDASLQALSPIALASETSSHPPSELLIDLTPRSEAPGFNFEIDSSDSSQHSGISQSEPDSFASFPGSVHSAEQLADHEGQVSTTSSIPGSLDHINDDLTSGTISEWDEATDGIPTPASWSEVGSVVSTDDEHHH